ncbi:MAG: UbiA family prenyltransferase [Hyphomicrobiaceae bacterium]
MAVLTTKRLELEGSSPPQSALALPLIVDADGCLVRADLRSELAIAELENTVKLFTCAIRGERTQRDAFPDVTSVAEFARKGVDVSSLPLEPELVDYIRACAETGREIHLVTRASQAIADAIAARVGGFTSATGSTAQIAMTDVEKLRYAKAQFPHGFAYAGNAGDLISSARALVQLRDRAANGKSPADKADQVEVELGDGSAGFRVGAKQWLKLLRCHQWSKNALVFVPLLLGHAYNDVAAIAACVTGFALLSLLASGTYVVNDLVDLDADRRHATKRNRPLASGDISAGTAIVVACGMIGGSLLGAPALGTAFLATLSAYLVTTLAYSFYLKRKLLVDVFVLAALFTLRVAMGIALAGVEPSPWLLTFTMFFFLSLSLAKRHVEIVNAAQVGQMLIPGRDYRAADLPLTVALGVGCNAVAMLIIFLYLAFDAMPLGFYRQPYWLWGAGFIVFLWSLRIWGLAHRGVLDSDPVAFAVRDRTSIVLGFMVLVVFGLAL